MTDVSLRIFGGFSLEDAKGQTIPLHLRKAEALLAFLAVCPNQKATRESLASILWGDFILSKARQSLRQALLALTRSFAEHEISVLRIDRQIISLDPDSITVDVVEFERHIEDGSPEALQQATTLYGGPLLADLTVNAIEFENWVATTRTKYQVLALQAHVNLTRHHESTGNLDSAIISANQALQIDSYREDIHRSLMRLYVARGMKSSALTQFRTCRDILRDDLAVDPDDETTELYALILGKESAVPVSETRDDGATAESDVADDEAAQAGAVDGGEGPQLIGRDAEMSLLREMLDSLPASPRNVAAITGPSGVGKTALLDFLRDEASSRGFMIISARAHETEQAWPFGLWNDIEHQISDKTDDADIERHCREARAELKKLLSNVSSASGAGEIGSYGRQHFYDTARALLTVLADTTRVAILVDDAQWADAESLQLLQYAAKRLGKAPIILGLTLLADESSKPSFASRAVANMSDTGHAVIIAPLPLDHGQTCQLIQILMRDLSAAERRGIDIDGIWQLSEGYPDIVAEAMRQPLESGSGDDNLPRQVRAEAQELLARCGRTTRDILLVSSVIALHSDFSVSYQLLERILGLGPAAMFDELETLSEAGVIEHGENHLNFPRRRICVAIYGCLEPLRRKALHASVAAAIEEVHAADIETRYSLLIHHHDGAGNRCKAAQYRVRLGWLEYQRGAFEPARVLFAKISPAAGRWSPDRDWRDLEIDACLGMAALYENESKLDQAQEFLERVSVVLKGDRDSNRRVITLTALSRVYSAKGDEDMAYRTANEAISLSGSDGRHSVWLTGERFMVSIHLFAENPAAAIDRLGRHEERYANVGRIRDEVASTTLLALSHAARGNFAAALEKCEAARRTAESVGSEASLAEALQFLGIVHAWQHEFDPAIKCLRKAFDLARARGDLFRMYVLHGYLGYAYSADDQQDKAFSHLNKAIAMAERLGTGFLLPFIKTWLAETFVNAGQDEEAYDCSHDAYDMAVEANNPWAQSIASRAIARALVTPRYRDFDLAMKAVEFAIASQDSIDLKFELAHSKIVLAKLLRAQGIGHHSSAVFEEASQMFQQMGMNIEVARAKTMAEMLRQPGVVTLPLDN